MIYWLLGITLFNLALRLLIVWLLYKLKRDSAIITDVLCDVVSTIKPANKEEEDNREQPDNV